MALSPRTILRPSVFFNVFMLTLFASTAVLAASAEQRSGLQIVYSGKLVVLHITQPTTVYDVLQSMCQGGHLDCQLTSEAKLQQVAPGEVQGTWEDVAAKVLQGTHFNYVLVQPSAEAGGRFLLQAAPIEEGKAFSSQSSASPNPVAARASDKSAHIPLPVLRSNRSTKRSSTRSGSRCLVESRRPNEFGRQRSPRVSICGIATTARSTWRSTKRRMRPVWRPSSRRLPQERARPRRRSTDQWTALRLTIRVVSRGPRPSSRIRCSTGITRKRR